MADLFRVSFLLLLIATLSACGGSSDASFDNGDEPVLIGLEVSPGEATAPSGNQVAYTATGTYSSGDTRDLTSEVVWSSADTVVATVDAAGVATALNPGRTRIQADIETFSGFLSDSGELEVLEAAQPMTLQVYPPQAVYSLGTTEDYRAMLIYSDGSVENVTFDADWSLDNDPPILAPYEAPDPADSPESRDIDDFGTAVAVRVGEDFLRVRYAGLEASSLAIVGEGTLESLQVQPRSERILQGTTLDYRAIGYYANGVSRDLTKVVTWQSSVPSVATISNTSPTRGVATGTSAGTTMISATLDDFEDATDLTVVSESAVKIDVFPPSAVVNEGGQQVYTAVAYLADGTSRDISASAKWESVDPTIATVSDQAGSKGLATGVSAGETTLTATFQGLSGTALIEVRQAEILSILVEPADSVLTSLTTQAYRATARFSSGRDRDVTDEVAWTSSDNTVAAVNNSDLAAKGLALALLPGQTIITASLADGLNTIDGDALLTVIAPDTGISVVVSPPQAEILVGEQQAYSATLLVGDQVVDVTDRVTWTSSTPAAHVDDTGLATGEMAGETAITATFVLPDDSAVSGSGELTVKENITVTEVLVDPPSASTIIGGSQQYTARALLSDGSEIDISEDVFWSSSDSAIAQVDADGVAIGKSEGAVDIVATLELGGDTLQGTARFQVLPPAVELESIIVTPPSAVIARGENQQYMATAVLSNGVTLDITGDVAWSSSVPAVASIVPGGLAKGEDVGLSDISAALEYEGQLFTDTVPLKVTEPIIDHLEISPRSGELLPGQVAQFSALAILSDASTVDITTTAQWYVTDPALAHVESGPNGGRLTALAEGATDVYIEYSFDGVSYPCLVGEPRCPAAVTIKPLEVESLRVLPPQSEVIVQSSQQFTAEALLNNGDSVDVTNRVTWSTNDSSIAQVDASGLATGVAIGEVKVIARGTDAEGTNFIATADLRVLAPPVTIEQLVVEPALSVILALPDASRQYQATALLSNGSAVDVTAIANWTTSDGSVAIVDANGVAYPISAGLTAVSASLEFEGNSYSDSGTLRVFAPPTVVDLDVQPKAGSIYIGNEEPLQYTATATLSTGFALDVTALAQWSIDDPAIATVGQGAAGGEVTGLSAGTSGVRAVLPLLGGGSFGCDDGCAGSVEVIDPAGIARLQVTPPDEAIALGTTLAYTATAFRNDGQVIDVTGDVTWEAADPAIAELVQSDGLFRGAQEGTTTISARLVTVDGTAMDATGLTVTAAEVTRVQVEPVEADILIGNQQQYQAWAYLTDGSAQDITTDPATTWSVAEDSLDVASISPSTGLALGLAEGIAPITALYNTPEGDFLDTVDLQVRPPEAVELRVFPDGVTAFPGDAGPFTADMIYEDGGFERVTEDVVWSSTDESVVTVSNADGSKGLANAVAPGLAGVQADHPNGLSGLGRVEILEAELLGLVIEPAEEEIIIGTSDQLSALALYSDDSALDVTGPAEWSSDSPAIVVVGNGEFSGRIVGVRLGTATITATYQGQSATAEITVAQKEIVEAIIRPDDAVLAASVTEQYRAIVTYNDGDSQEVTDDVIWDSSLPSVASISNNPSIKGRATAVSPGTTMISAVLEGLEFTPVPLVVEDQTLVSIDVIPADETANVSDSIFYTAIGNYDSGLTTDLTFQSAWLSTDPAVASVNNFTEQNMVALANGSGMTQFEATFAGIAGSGALEVIAEDCGEDKPDSILIVEAKTVEVGGTVQFTARGVWSDGCEQDITNDTETVFQSRDRDICRFDSPKGGLATGISVGVADVDVTHRGRKDESTCTVID